MTNELRELLHDAAAAPTRPADVSAAMTTARRRRRRRVGFGAGALAVVLAVVTIGLAATGGDGPSARVAIGPRQMASVPDGWTPVALESGIRFAMPPGWDVFDFGTIPGAERRIAIGTARPPDESMVVACSAEGAIPTEPGTWLTVWEYPGALGSEIQGPGGDVIQGPGGDVLGIVDRPADFHTGGLTGSCAFVGNAAAGELGGAFEIFAFRDAGRVFMARVVVAHATGTLPSFDEANEVLNTLQISPLEPTTTTTPVTPTTEPATTTTSPPFVPVTADEQAISQLVVRWLRGQNDDEIRATIEDADSILAAIHEGTNQYSQNLPYYTGYANSVQIVDADHAVVDYTLLLNGAPLWGRRTGAAIRINGVWMVSRDTECALLAVGSIACPPRSNP